MGVSGIRQVSGLYARPDWGNEPSQESASTTRSDSDTTRSGTGHSLPSKPTSSEAAQPTIKRRPTVKRVTCRPQLKRRRTHRLVDGQWVPVYAVSPRASAKAKPTKPCTAQPGKQQSEKPGILV